MKQRFFRKVLKNGMTVMLEKRNVPVVSIAIAARCGALHEEENEKGISHFIEHMLYKGTKKRTCRQIAEDIESRGGDLNGFTDNLITAYWCKMPSKHLDIALDVLSDMVKNSVFDAKELEKERKVIFEEIKMRKDNPRIYSMDKIHSFLYEKPFGTDIIGTYESMNSITREKMLERFRKTYVPSNLILAAVGDADFSKIVKFAEKNFMKKKGSIKKPRIILKNEIKTEERRGIDQASLIFAYHSPTADKKESYAAMILGTLMAGGMSSRLFNEIREKRNLAYAVKEEIEITKDYSNTLIYVGTTKEKVEEVKKIILDEFAKVSENLGEEELNRTKEQIIGNYQISMEDSQEQLMNLLGYEIEGNAAKFYELEKNIRNATLNEVKNLAKLGKYSFFALMPE
jgi:predicted Zn-dependent peptidase